MAGTLARITGFSRLSLRMRITMGYLLVFGATLILFSAALYHMLSNHLQKEFDLALYNRAIDITDGINVNLFGDIFVEHERWNRNAKIFPFSLGKSFLQLTTPRGEVFARSNNLESPENPGGAVVLKSLRQDFLEATRSGVALRSLSAQDLGVTEKMSDGTYYRLLTYWVTSKGFGPFFLQYAVPLKPLHQELTGIKRILSFSVPITLLLAVVISLLTLKSALTPLTHLIETLKSLDRRNLNERLHIPGTGDEIEALSVSINDFLARLERAFLSQDAFVANASHELKTPLAILRGELDVLRSRTRTPEEIENFFKSASQELDALTRLVGELLVLARIDAGEDSLNIAPLDYAELILDEVARLQSLAKARKVHIKLELIPDVAIQGDGELLRLVIRNLLENAIKYSPAQRDACVEVKLSASPRGPSSINEVCLLSVRNEGSGIPAELRSRILERFVRGHDKASGTPGFGLGLALAHRIVMLHGGTIHIDSQESVSEQNNQNIAPIKHAVFTVELPTV